MPDLEPGESVAITFALGLDDLAFWSISDDSFRVGAGMYTVRVGDSSDHLPLSGSFQLTSSVLYDSATGVALPASLPVLANMALGRPVTCSSVEGVDNACSHSVDADLKTRWSSQFSDPQWIQVDLGSRQSIERVILHWETAYGRVYQVQVSDDALNWTDIYSTNAGHGAVDNLDMSALGRYVRVYVTERGTEWGNSLWELEVFACQRWYKIRMIECFEAKP